MRLHIYTVVLFGFFCFLFPDLSKSQEVNKIGYRISGEILSLTDYDGKIFLFGRKTDGSQFKDSTFVKNGKFYFTGKLDEPTRVSIYSVKSDSFPRPIGINLYLENSNIFIKGTDNNIITAGSKIHTESDSITRLMNMLTGLDTIKVAYRKAYIAKDSVALKRILSQNSIALAAYRNLSQRYVEEHKKNFLSLDYLGDMISGRDELSVRKAKELFNQLDESIKFTDKGKKLQEILNFQEKGYIVGKQVGDLIVKDKNGNDISLNDFRGRYVLLEFWASWCKPCRAENPNLIKAYSKLEDSGFEILAISLDIDKVRWLKAIEEDQLPWIHVSDLKKNNAAAAQFGVDAIPANFLVDPNGKVIARALRGNRLEEELNLIFKKNK